MWSHLLHFYVSQNNKTMWEGAEHPPLTGIGLRGLVKSKGISTFTFRPPMTSEIKI